MFNDDKTVNYSRIRRCDNMKWQECITICHFVYFLSLLLRNNLPKHVARLN